MSNLLQLPPALLLRPLILHSPKLAYQGLTPVEKPSGGELWTKRRATNGATVTCRDFNIHCS